MIPAGRKFGRGTAQPAGEIDVPLGGFVAPAKYTLHVALPASGIKNEWAFSVYPADRPEVPAPGIHFSRTFDVGGRAQLAAGNTVLLLPRREDLAGRLLMGFTTFYWTTLDRSGGQSSAAGLRCDPGHPLFRDFPTDGHTNWQWWELQFRASLLRYLQSPEFAPRDHVSPEAVEALFTLGFSSVLKPTGSTER